FHVTGVQTCALPISITTCCPLYSACTAWRCGGQPHAVHADRYPDADAPGNQLRSLALPPKNGAKPPYRPALPAPSSRGMGFVSGPDASRPDGSSRRIRLEWHPDHRAGFVTGDHSFVSGPLLAKLVSTGATIDQSRMRQNSAIFLPFIFIRTIFFKSAFRQTQKSRADWMSYAASEGSAAFIS